MTLQTTESNSPGNNRLDRRGFNKAVGSGIGALAGFHFFPSLAQKKLEKPTLVGIGAGGKGKADLLGCRDAGFEVIGLVDVVDYPRLDLANIGDKKFRARLEKMGQVRSEFPEAEFFTDYRQMLADLGDRVDAVTVSTPDHHHFHATALAMQAGKHVYCQKPLTHSVWEARQLTRLSKELPDVVTQMGNQAHAKDHLRECVELIRAGLIGKVREIHCWTNRPIWPQGFNAAPRKQSVPEGIDWEQWIGPAPHVDYSPLIAPFAWRGWWDYGTGALGDMACHIMDLGYWAMEAPAAASVQAQQNGSTHFSPPIHSKIKWEFPAGRYTDEGGLTLHWYDGYIGAQFNATEWALDTTGKDYNHPNENILDGMSFAEYGSVIIGTEGKLFFHRAKKNWVLKTSRRAADISRPEKVIPRAPEQDNYREWHDAIVGKLARTESNFALAGPLTETVLLGVIAQRCPDQKLVWNPEQLAFDNRPELDAYIRRPYRDGWEWAG